MGESDNYKNNWIFWCKARDYLLAAFLAVMVISIPQNLEINSAINASMLKLAMAIFRLQNQVVAELFEGDAKEKTRLAEGVPVVVMLSGVLYEKHFNSTSPLDRKKLKEIIEIITSDFGEGFQLVVDLDISPVLNFVSADDGRKQIQKENEDELYEVLKAIGEKGSVVLTTPAPVSTPESYRKKNEWMGNMCDSPSLIEFGLPYLYEDEGVVLRRSAESDTLAEVAKCLSDGRDDCREICSRVKNFKKISLDFLWGAEANGKPKMEVINANYFKNYRVISAHSIEQFKSDWAEFLASLGGRKKLVVFLGGSYGYTDKYFSAGGEQPGVVLHAAGFYTANNEVKNISKFFSWVLAIMFALIGGLLVEIFRKGEKTWVISVLPDFVLPGLGLFMMSLVQGLLLRWNIVFSAAIITEVAVLYASIYPTLRPSGGYVGKTGCVVFQSGKSALMFWVLVIVAAALAMEEIKGLLGVLGR